MKSIKSILPSNLNKNIQNQKKNSSTFWFAKTNNRGYKQLYLRRNHTESYLHGKSDHSASLKKCILYSEILHIKKICSTNSEFERNCKVLQKEVRTHASSIETEIKIIKTSRKERIDNIKNNTESSSVTNDGDT